MFGQVSWYARNIILLPCVVTQFLINYIGRLGHRTCVWLRSLCPRDQRINNIREQQLNSPETTTVSSIPSSPTPQFDLDFYKSHFINYLNKVIITDPSVTEFDKPEYKLKYKGVLKGITDHGNNFLTFIEEQTEALPKNAKDLFIQRVAAHLIIDKSAHQSASYNMFLSAIVKKTSETSAPLLFAACLLDDVSLIEKCISDDGDYMGVINIEGLIPFNFLSQSIYDQLIKDGKVPEEIQNLCYEGIMIKEFYKTAKFIEDPNNCLRVSDVAPNSPPAKYYKHTSVCDYYCANYALERRAIAASGPQNHTVYNFWRMVLESDTEVIVQLDSSKCCQYWPKGLNNFINFQDIKITYDSNVDLITLKKTSIITRKFLVNGKPITHIEFRGWVDGDVISVKALKSLAKAIYDAQPNRFLVHCWRGLGRTGVAIIFYEIYFQILNGRRQSALEIFKQVRGERGCSVQTHHQFRLILKTERKLLKEQRP